MDIKVYSMDPDAELLNTVDAVLAGAPYAHLPPDADPVTAAAVARFGLYGGEFGYGQDSLRDRLDSLQAVADYADRATHDRRVGSAWMDTSTLTAVHECVQSATLYPTALLDLETFVRTAVLYESVLSFPIRHAAAGAGFNHVAGSSPVFIELDPGDFGDLSGGGPTGLPSILYGIWHQAARAIAELVERQPGYGRREDEAEFTALQDAWDALLGIRPSPQDLSSEPLESDWPSPAQDLIPFIIAVADPKVDDAVVRGRLGSGQLQRKFVADATQRSWFNTRFADQLGLAYSANATRMPFRRFYLQREARVTRRLQVADVIQQAVGERARNIGSISPLQVALPSFLSVALSRMSGAADFYAVVAQMRSDAKPLRSRLRHLEKAENGGTPADWTRELELIRRAAARDAENLTTRWRWARPPVAAALWLAPLAVPHLGTPLLAACAILSGSVAIPDDDFQALISRLMRSRTRIVADMAATAADIGADLTKASTLFDLGPGGANAHAQLLRRCAQLGFA